MTAQRKRRGPLHPILWRGNQWAVTSYGIEALDGRYAITRHRLDDPYWEAHMADKEWVDIADFAEALRIAGERFEQW